MQERAIYTHTDSFIYIQNDEPPLIESGDKLSSITNELQPGEFIDELVSGGPKNYAYRVGNRTDKTKKPETVCKVRGITLNYSASQMVNVDVIRDMILNRRPDEVLTVHADRKIKRKRKEGRMRIFRRQRIKFTEFRFSRGGYKITIRCRSDICLPTYPEV